MKTPKTLYVLRCRACNGEFFANEERITLHPGNETELPDELTIIIKKVARCTGCKEVESRTKGGRRRKLR